MAPGGGSGGRPGIAEVARRAGVTPAVVSRVLNRDPTLRVRAATHERVLAAARELDYIPHHAARALRRSRSNVIGLAVHDLANPVYSDIIVGAQRAAADAGYMLLLAEVEGLARGDATFRSAVNGSAIDGLLLQRAGTAADRTVTRSAAARVPTVLLNDRSSRTSSVALDDVRGARLATEHLIALGHRRIGHLRLGGTRRSGDRVRGWRQALSRAGLPVPARWLLDGGPTVEQGYAGMRDLLALSDRPTGLVVANVLAAIGALTAAREAGLGVPEEMSLVAFHDVLFAAHCVPSLTTVAMPLRELGAAAVSLLLERLAGAPPRRLVVRDPAPAVIRRDSTASPRPAPS